MAFTKNIMTNFGIPSAYQVIEGFELDVATETIKITVNGYVSEEVKDKGVEPVVTKTYTYAFSDLTGDLRQLIYPLLSSFPGERMHGAEGDVAVTPFFDVVEDILTISPSSPTDSLLPTT